MAKFHKLGTVQLKKDKSGEYIVLGNPNGKKYAFSVDVRIRDANGEVVFQGTDVLVNMKDPRTRPGIKPEQAEKIPAFILQELFIVEQDD